MERDVGSVRLDELWNRVGKARGKIDKVYASSESDREEEHKKIDAVIIKALDIEANKLYSQALKHYNAEEFNLARRECEGVRDVYQAATVPKLRYLQASGSAAWDSAAAMLTQMDMDEKPTLRYVLKGTMNTGNTTGAFIDDVSTGETLKVKVGDKVGNFTVEQVDGRRGVVVLRGKQGTFEIQKQ
jgi:hypothetical protein